MNTLTAPQAVPQLPVRRLWPRLPRRPRPCSRRQAECCGLPRRPRRPGWPRTPSRLSPWSARPCPTPLQAAAAEAFPGSANLRFLLLVDALVLGASLQYCRRARTRSAGRSAAAHRPRRIAEPSCFAPRP